MRYADTIKGRSPVIFAPLEEASGTAIADSGSKGDDGTYTGSGVSYQAFGPLVREVSYAAAFDGATGRGSFGGITGADLPTLPFTAEAWIRPASVPGPSGDTCLNLYASDSSESATIGVGVDGRWVYSQGNDGGDLASGSGPIANGNMQHLVLAIDSTTQRRFYVDSVLQTLDPTPVAWDGDGGASATCLLAIGYDGGAGAFFPGSMSRVAYYKTALTTAQVEAHYRAGVLTPLMQGVTCAIKADAEAWALTAGRVFANQLPDSPMLPAVRVAVLDDRPHHRLTSGEHFDASIQVDVYADRSDQPSAWSIDSNIKAVLNRRDIRVFGYEKAACIQTSRGVVVPEPSFSRVRSTYQIFANVS